MSIEKMSVKDLDVIVRLEEELFFSSAWEKEDFIYEINENPFASYYIYRDDDIIKGYIGTWMMYDQCQITTIGVDPRYQRQKIASSLMDFVFEQCQKQNYGNINLEVAVSNEKAISLYKKYGFEVKATRKDYYANHEDAYLMVKEWE